jgi:hypothetical protein
MKENLKGEAQIEDFRIDGLDSHTYVLSEVLTDEEKIELGIDAKLQVHINEIGFKYPKTSESWKKDCFNVMIYLEDDVDFAESSEVELYSIDKLPKRFRPTFKKIVKMHFE